MPEITQDLKLQNDPSTIVRPNIVAANIPNAAIDETKLGGASVSTAKIQDEAVSTAKVQDEAITSLKLASASVTPAKIANSAVTSAKINNSAVTTPKINNAAVTLAKVNIIDKTDWMTSNWNTFAKALTDVVNIFFGLGFVRAYHKDGSDLKSLTIVKADTGEIVIDIGGTTTTINDNTSAGNFFITELLTQHVHVVSIE